jgi:phage repressor protein C with HTH and peptisase S24 domain
MELKEMIADWIKASRIEAGMSGAALGEKLAIELGTDRGNSKGNISHWETQRHNPSLQQLLAIAKVTGRQLPPAILGGMLAGAPLGNPGPTDADSIAARIAQARAQAIADGDSAYSSVRPANDDDDIAIPLVELRLSAGVSGFAVDQNGEGPKGYIKVDQRFVASNRYDPTKLFALHVRGDSMEPKLSDGDTVIINTADIKPVDGVIFAVNYEGEAVIKRLVRDAGDWWLTSDNPDQRKYHRKICRGPGCIIVGRAVQAITKL